MKNILILFTSLVFFAACATQPKTTLEKAKETPSKVTTDDWYLFDYQEQDYMVLFPTTPKPVHQMVDTEMGTLEMKIFMCEMLGAGQEEVVYAVSTTNYPMGVIHSSKTNVLEQFFRGAVDGAVSNIGGKLLSETKIELDGFEGRAIEINAQDGKMLVNMRMYLIGNCMYILQTLNELGKDKSLYINRFFDSFRVDETYKEAARRETVTIETDSGWRLYESKNGGYKITFPKVPIESENAIDTEIGQLNLYSTTCEGSDANTMCMSAYIDYPDSLINTETTNLEEFYTNVINDSARGINGKVLEIKNIKLNDIEGREVKMGIGEHDIPILSTMRIFLVASRVYMIQAVTAEENIDALTKRFLDSFQLVE